MIDEFDIYQLSQIGNFMSSPGASANVPDEYWSGCLEPALEASLKDFK